MNRSKRILFLSLAVCLFFCLPVEAFANFPIKTIIPKIPSHYVKLEKNLKQGITPIQKDKQINQEYQIPIDYPLVKTNHYIGALLDSVGSLHFLTYKQTKVSSTNQLDVQVGYQSPYSKKDKYLNIEFYTNDNGAMTFLGYNSYYIGSTQNAVLHTTLDKSQYSNQPYIYMVIGTYSDPKEGYYSDATYFKVANPDYKGSPAPEMPNNYELISNESTDSIDSESTGTFSINNDQYAFNKKINSNAYRLDFVKPFDSEKYKDQVLTKKPFLEKSIDKVNDTKSFWVTNLANGQDEQLSMTLEYNGTHTEVWVYKNHITAPEATQLGKEFNNVIHPLDHKFFGSESDVDGNGKIDILCYDIQDGFNGSGGFVAGYFSPQDLYNVAHSNHAELINIDTNPLMGMGSSKDVKQAYSTMAHEFQHMINYNQKVFVQKLSSSMDTWMDEGLSMAAEQIYTNKPLQDRIDYYNYDPEITSGHSLLYWDYSGDTLANYSLSYLFMQYLKDQCGQGNAIFKELINDPHTDYQSVQDIIQKYIDPNLSFGQFMTDFRAALLLKNSTGLYGFKGDPTFDSIVTKVYSGTDSLSLVGGSAVFKGLPSPDAFNTPSDKGPDVTYTLLTKTEDHTPPPNAPIVYDVGNGDSFVAGLTETPNLPVFVTKNGEMIGSAITDSFGLFIVPISKQAVGTELQIYAENGNGTKSSSVKVTVKDNTPPRKPIVYSFGDNQYTIHGKAEPRSTIIIKNGKSTIGKGTTSSKGKFQVKLKKKQKAGTVLKAYARDAAHNQSPSTVFKVKDKTPPKEPTVYKVTTHSTVVTGHAEKYSTVYLYRGKTFLGKAVAGSKGHYKIKMPKEKWHTILSVYAKDKAGNKSKTRKVKVY